LTVHSRAILKTVKSMCNDIKKIKCTLMKCHTNDNSTPSTPLPQKLSHTAATPGHNHFESPNTSYYSKVRVSNMVMTLRAVLYIIIWSNTEQSTII
jgi:hypothetical protein